MKTNYSDFEYILCNRVFPMAVLSPFEYSGVRSLIIQDWSHKVIMITSNKEENIIRVSYEDTQEIYENYDDAIAGIKEHLGRK